MQPPNEQLKGGSTMKANIKKLVLLMIIAVITTFMMAATVTAESPGHRSIQGVYAATGSVTCLVAPLGFDDQLIPKGGASMVMTGTMEGVFTFYRDGTGHIERPHAPVVILNSSLGVPFPSAGDSKDSSNFTYEVERGKITLTQVPGSHSGEFTDGPLDGYTYQNENRNWWGKVSPDGKTIVLNSGLPDIITSPPPSVEGLVCNGSAVLTWQHN
jgi:hypothetical protein